MQLITFFLQLCLAALTYAAPLAQGAVTISSENAWKYGTGGGVVGFAVLILDILVWIEVLKSNRPPLSKLLWCLLVFILPIAGIIIYWLFSNRAQHNAGGYEPIG